MAVNVPGDPGQIDADQRKPVEPKVRHSSVISGAPDRPADRSVRSGPIRPQNRTARRPLVLLLAAVLAISGCAKYNTYFNAKKSYDNAEQVREMALKNKQDPPKPAGAQKNDYETAIRKSQKVLDEYPGHSLTDDVLFLQGKSYHRLESYRMSIRKFDLLFTNYPQSPYLEESLYLMGLNYLLIGALDRSQEFLDRLAKLYPESRYQAETRKVSGDNAFNLEEWETAVESYQAYLSLDTDIAERDRVGLKLARSFWELEEYYKAAEILQEVSNRTTSADLGFRARLLRARVHVRIGDYDLAETLLKELETEARIYNAQGEVLLIQAERLVAQGKGDEASPLLENMPTDWETPAIKARASDILGYLYMERGEWDLARPKFQTALLKRDELDDEDRTRRINDSLQAYLAAENALPDASGERIAALRLLQANAMLFGFDHPEEAANLYALAAADTAADSTVAARALYGAYLAHDRYLDAPDSAAGYAARLEADYPDSPQAFELRSGQESDLLGYLMAVRTEMQAERYASLSEEERTALVTARVGQKTTVSRAEVTPGVRRRMVYLSRRDNLMFAPTADDIARVTRNRNTTVAPPAAGLSREAVVDSLPAVGAPSGSAGTALEAAGQGATLPDSLVAEPAVLDPQEMARQAEEQAAADEAARKEEEEEKRDKERDKNWDFLR
jgi:tetratricopeptide (TPR) repeat protein